MPKMPLGAAGQISVGVVGEPKLAGINHQEAVRCLEFRPVDQNLEREV